MRKLIQKQDANGMVTSINLPHAHADADTPKQAWERLIEATFEKAQRDNRLVRAIDARRIHPAKGQPIGRVEFDGWITDVMAFLEETGVHPAARPKVKAGIERIFRELDFHGSPSKP